MGEIRGTRLRGRLAALGLAAALTVAGLVPAQSASAEVTPELSEQEFVAELSRYLSTKNGVYSVTVRELEGEQRTISLNGSRRVEPASTIKLFYAWAALQAVDRGTLSLSSRLASGKTVANCLSVMIEVSDNPCAVDLRLKLGMRQLNALFASEGYTGTSIVLDSKGRYVTKRTTTDDLALLLSRLATGELLSEAQTAQFTKRLLAQIWRHRISSGVPPGAVVGSKSGQLWVSSGMVEADTAIVYGPNGTYVLAAIGTHRANVTAIRGISTYVYRYLQGPVAEKAVFPAKQYVTKIDVYLRKSPAGTRITQVRKGTAVQVLSSDRIWLRVKVGSRYGWLPYAHLALGTAYRWPAPPG